MEQRLMRRAQAAEYLGIGTTLFDRDVRPYVPTIRVAPGAIAFDVRDLDRWADWRRDTHSQPATKTMGNPDNYNKKSVELRLAKLLAS